MAWSAPAPPHVPRAEPGVVLMDGGGVLVDPDRGLEHALRVLKRRLDASDFRESLRRHAEARSRGQRKRDKRRRAAARRRRWARRHAALGRGGEE